MVESTDNLSKRNNSVADKYEFLYHFAVNTLQSETDRGESLLKQAVQLQKIFSILIAAISLPISFLLNGNSIFPSAFIVTLYFMMLAPLFASLIFSSLVQKRRKYKTYPRIKQFEQYMQERENKFATPEQRYAYYVHTLAEFQESQYEENEKRLKWVDYSMYSFWLSLLMIAVSFLSCVIFWLGRTVQ